MTSEAAFLPVGYSPGKIVFDEWTEHGARLKNMARVLPFLIGDWLNYGELHYGEKYAQALDQFDGLTLRTLQQYSYVARQVKVQARLEVLSFRHHDAVARLPCQDQRRLLRLAVREGLTSGDLRERVKELLKEDDPELEDKPKAGRLCPHCGRNINADTC